MNVFLIICVNQTPMFYSGYGVTKVNFTRIMLLVLKLINSLIDM